LCRTRSGASSVLLPPLSAANYDHLLLSRHNQVGEASDAVADTVWQGKLPKSTATVINPRAVFPWRHEDYPLPRLIPGSEECVAQGGTYGPGFPYLEKHLQFVVTHFAASQLGTPWYQLLFNGWKQDLAASSSWAFSQAVAGLLANTYRIPFDDIRQDDDEDGDFDVDLSGHTMTTDSLLQTEEDEIFPELEYMVEEKLRTLYQSAHEHGRDQLQIKLQMKPTSSWFLGAYMVPFLTRETVKKTPALKNTYKNMWAELSEEEQKLDRDLSLIEIGKFTVDKFRLLARDQAELLDDHVSLKSTIVAQVLVECDEVFYVKDLKTGKIIQGDGEVRKVSHLVRLEVVVDAQKAYGKPGAHMEPVANHGLG